MAAVVSSAAVVLGASALLATASPNASAIINGNPVYANAYPFIASLTMNNEAGKPVGYCTGTLVNRSWVITAAHCITDAVPKNGVTVMLDTTDVADPAKAVFKTSSEDYLVAPQHVPHGDDWDLAMVKLAAPAPSSIPAVKLATLQDFAALTQGYHLALGYGDCVKHQLSVNTQLRATAMAEQLTMGDGMWFEDSRAPYPAGAAGCGTLPTLSPPPPTSGSATAIPSTPGPDQMGPARGAQAQVPKVPAAVADSGCPTPAPAAAAVPAAPANAPAAPAAPSGTPVPTPRYAIPSHGDSGGPLLGMTCSGQWIELGVLSKVSRDSALFGQVSDPQISSWILFAELDQSMTVTPSGTLPSAQKGSPYSVTFSAQFGDEPYTWSLPRAYRIPRGLTLSSTGNLTGTPTAAGTYSFIVRVTDRVGEFQDTKVTIDVTK